VTPSTFVIASAWSYGLALAGYLVFGIRVAIGSRNNPRGRPLILALFTTALWAGLSLPIAYGPAGDPLFASNIAGAVRYAAWFFFLWYLMGRPGSGSGSGRGAVSLPVATVALLLVAGVVLGEQSFLQKWVDIPQAGFVAHLITAILGLVLTEQLLRRIQPRMRWAIKPLVVAMVGLFGLDLFLYADALLFGQLDPDIWVARGFGNVLLIPFLAVATARNIDWTVDLHLSRVAVFNSSALLVSGAFLLAVAGAGYFVRYFGGSWGRALQIELVFAAGLAVALVASSGRFRSKLKVFISKHFFSYRYDYREEWLRFTRTISTENSAQALQVRTVNALGDLVESPAGMLFISEERGFVTAARWNMPPVDIVEAPDAALPAFLAHTGWVVSIPELRADPARYSGLALPEWLDRLIDPWLIVPLASGPELFGFVVLSAPRTAIEVDWEVRDLLKTASRQAASYLGEGRATEALLEARKFDAFNRMSAFVVHDLKNLVSQLSLMLRNAERHRDNPAFQADMLHTVKHVVGRMNALMLQLRTGTQPVESPRHVDFDRVLRRVCAAKADARVSMEIESPGPVVILGHEDRLEHVIGHLVQNAVDASLPAGHIGARLAVDGRFALLQLIDRGVGMAPEFVRERLFKPFQTTKASGMGIGVYESQQYVTGLGGEIRIDSEQGAGTCVDLRLPLAEAASGVAGGALAEKEVV
jgi:putative PEP-CTERM system histidine kinase